MKVIISNPNEVKDLLLELYKQLPKELRPKEKVIPAEEVIMEAIEYIISLKKMRIGQSLIKPSYSYTSCPILAPRPTSSGLQLTNPIAHQVIEEVRKESSKDENEIATLPMPKPTNITTPKATNTTRPKPPRFIENDTDTVQGFLLPPGSKVIKVPRGRIGVLISGNKDLKSEETILELAPNTKIPIIWPEGVTKTTEKPKPNWTQQFKTKEIVLLKRDNTPLVPTPGHPNPKTLNMGPKRFNPTPVAIPGVTLVNMDRAEAEKIEKKIAETTGEKVRK